eukprot:2778767-Amphidinium_carterae.1
MASTEDQHTIPRPKVKAEGFGVDGPGCFGDVGTTSGPDAMPKPTERQTFHTTPTRTSTDLSQEHTDNGV